MLKISDFLCRKAININIAAKDKKGAIAELVDMLAKEKKVKDTSKAVQSILDREKIGTTGVGQGIAIPHSRTDVVGELIAAFGISKKGIDFESLDGEPVHLIFLILSPPDTGGQHLRALARISRLFKDKFFRQALIDSNSTEEVTRIIEQEDTY